MRKVFTDNSVIAHYWANRTQEDARNPRNNFYFEGNSIYSYGRHFEIARHFNDEVILFTTDTNSQTTSKHIWDVRRAIPYGKIVFNVPKFFYVDDSPVAHRANVENYLSEIRDLIGKSSRARTNSKDYFNRMAGWYEELKSYVNYFDINSLAKEVAPILYAYDELLMTPELVMSVFGAEIKQESEARKKFLSDRTKRLKKDFEELLPLYEVDALSKEDRVRWNEVVDNYLDRDRILFSINGTGNVVTSKGIELELDTALMFLGFLLEYRKSEDKPHRVNMSINDIHGTNFTVREISEDGSFVAGCHKVAWADVEGFATRQGLLVDGVIVNRKAELV